MATRKRTSSSDDRPGFVDGYPAGVAAAKAREAERRAAKPKGTTAGKK